MKKMHLSMKQKNVIMCIISVVIACIFLFPIYWIVINSFKMDGEIFASTPTLWPQELPCRLMQSSCQILQLR